MEPVRYLSSVWAIRVADRPQQCLRRPLVQHGHLKATIDLSDGIRGFIWYAQSGHPSDLVTVITEVVLSRSVFCAVPSSPLASLPCNDIAYIPQNVWSRGVSNPAGMIIEKNEHLRIQMLAYRHLSSRKSEELRARRGGGGTGGDIDDIALNGEESVAVAVLGDKRERLGTAEGEKLAVGDKSATVSTATAREHDELVTGGTARVEVEASLGLDEAVSSWTTPVPSREDLQEC